MIRLKVGEKGIVYFSDDLRRAGYVGNLEAIPNACVMVIPKPGAKNRDIAESLEYMIKDFDHRARLEGENDDPKDAPLEIAYEKPLKINSKRYRVYLNLETKRFRMELIKKAK